MALAGLSYPRTVATSLPTNGDRHRSSVSGSAIRQRRSSEFRSSHHLLDCLSVDSVTWISIPVSRPEDPWIRSSWIVREDVIFAGPDPAVAVCCHLLSPLCALDYQSSPLMNFSRRSFEIQYVYRPLDVSMARPNGKRLRCRPIRKARTPIPIFFAASAVVIFISGFLCSGCHTLQLHAGEDIMETLRTGIVHRLYQSDELFSFRLFRFDFFNRHVRVPF